MSDPILESDENPTHQRGLVSVIIPSYNKAEYIIQTLESVSAQDYPHIELIVIDDCSTDNSVKIVSKWAEAQQFQTQLRVHTDNQGVCRTLNEGLSIAQGEFICALAADDTYHPHKISRHVQIFKDNPRAALVYGDAAIIDGSGVVLSNSIIDEYDARMGSRDVFHELISRGNLIPALTATMRRNSLDLAGPYDENLAFEDYDMWLRLSRLGEVICSNSVDANYRVTNSSLANQLGLELEIGQLSILSKYRNVPGVDQGILHARAKTLAILIGTRENSQSPVGARTRAIATRAASFGGTFFAAQTIGEYIKIWMRRRTRIIIETARRKTLRHN